MSDTPALGQWCLTGGAPGPGENTTPIEDSASEAPLESGGATRGGAWLFRRLLLARVQPRHGAVEHFDRSALQARRLLPPPGHGEGGKLGLCGHLHPQPTHSRWSHSWGCVVVPPPLAGQGVAQAWSRGTLRSIRPTGQTPAPSTRAWGRSHPLVGHISTGPPSHQTTTSPRPAHDQPTTSPPPDHHQTTTRPPPDHHQTTTRPRPDHHQTTTRPPPSHQTTTRPPPDHYQTTTKPPDHYQTTTRPLPDHHQTTTEPPDHHHQTTTTRPPPHHHQTTKPPDH
ncbi:hypothetical protein ACOMHN_040053 [Nucella lapillus]